MCFFRLSDWYSPQTSVALSWLSTASLAAVIAPPSSMVSRLPTPAARTARMAMVIETRLMNGSCSWAACSACSACSWASSAGSWVMLAPWRDGAPPESGRAYGGIVAGNLERAKRFELSTPTLARLCSTTELRPRSSRPWFAPKIREAAYGRRPPGLQGAGWPGRLAAHAGFLQPALVDVVLAGGRDLLGVLALEVVALPGLLG